MLLSSETARAPHTVEIANKGWQQAMKENEEIKARANVIDGTVTYSAVADAVRLDWAPVDRLLALA